jgi:PIN domain nuclease of toxin-antitoxin system
VRVLLDTHVWLWWLTSPELLSPPAHDVLKRGSNELILSAASCWEIAIKHSLGKLKLPESPDRLIPRTAAEGGVELLPVSPAHALRVASLPLHHRDPFDRLLIAQAQAENLAIVTRDPMFKLYDVGVRW